MLPDTTQAMNNNPLDGQVAHASQFYPNPCSHLAPWPAQDVKPRTRKGRKKSRVGQSGISGTKKRKLSQEQVILLERNFGNDRKLESQRKDRLATELGLDPRQVAVWFQNRRARFKSKKLEEEYLRLRAAHENVVLEKCRLEAELLKLNDSLNEAEKEIQQLSERLDNRGASNSPISSTDAVGQPQFPGDYAYDDVFFTPEPGYLNEIFERINLVGKKGDQPFYQ